MLDKELKYLIRKDYYSDIQKYEDFKNIIMINSEYEKFSKNENNPIKIMMRDLINSHDTPLRSDNIFRFGYNFSLNKFVDFMCLMLDILTKIMITVGSDNIASCIQRDLYNSVCVLLSRLIKLKNPQIIKMCSEIYTQILFDDVICLSISKYHILFGGDILICDIMINEKEQIHDFYKHNINKQDILEHSRSSFFINGFKRTSFYKYITNEINAGKYVHCEIYYNFDRNLYIDIIIHQFTLLNIIPDFDPIETKAILLLMEQIKVLALLPISKVHHNHNQLTSFIIFVTITRTWILFETSDIINESSLIFADINLYYVSNFILKHIFDELVLQETNEKLFSIFYNNTQEGLTKLKSSKNNLQDRCIIDLILARKSKILVILNDIMNCFVTLNRY